MSRYTIILCTLSILWLFLGIKAVLNDYRKKPHLLFAALCLTMTIWTFFIGAAYSLGDVEQVVFFLKIAYIGGFLFSPVNLHFYLTAGNTFVRPYILALNYLPSLMLMISNFIRFFIFSAIERHNNEWLGILNTGSIRFRIYLGVVLITFIVSSALIINWNLKTKLNKEKIQSGLMLVLFILTYFSSMLLTMILPVFNIHRFQHIGIVFFSMYVIGLYFLIVKIRFMNINKSTSADEIFSNINELIFILGNDLVITDVNNAATVHCGGPAESIKNRLFTGAINGSSEFIRLTDDIKEGKTKNFTTVINYKTPSGSFPARAYVSGITDRYNDLSGFLVILGFIKEIYQFQKIYKITARELEIVSMTVSGSTYREISAKLSISERTVERHLTNIYNKLGINNRIELFRVASEYNFRL